MADKPFGAGRNGAQDNPNEDHLDGDESVVSPEGKDDGQKPKKTPAQIERERMRRRRRRQRRKIMGSLAGSEGRPVKEQTVEPKLVKPKSEGAKSEKPKSEEIELEEPKPKEPDIVSAHSFDLGDEDFIAPEPEEKLVQNVAEEVPTQEQAGTEYPPVEESKPFLDEPAKEEPLIIEPEMDEPAKEEPMKLESVMDEPAKEEPVVEEVRPESSQPSEEEISTVHEVEAVPPPEHIEEPVVTELEPFESLPADDLTFGEPDKRKIVPIGRLHEVEEHPVEEVSLHGQPEQPMDEVEKTLPHEEVPEGEGEHKEKREPPAEEKAEKDVLEDKPTAAFKIAGFFAEAGKKAVPALLHGFAAIAGFLKKFFLSFKFQYLAPVLLIAAIGGGGYFVYTQEYHVKIYNYVMGFFQSKPVEKVEVDKNVKVDENDIRRFGIATALLFAQNEGSVHDLVPVQIFNADFFGGLKEPKVRGETGISAATYYGELKDQGQFVNLFQEYVKKLQNVQSLYKTDVYAMLDQSTRRDEALLKYLDQLQKGRDESSKVLDQIHINLDDLKVSYDSLNPEKGRLETDFFTSLQNLEPEKSDQLLKSFIDVTQKQAALKARNSALSKLADYYMTALQRMDTRIKAVDKNRDVLIQGIRVVDIPGADLNIIIKSTN